MGCQCREGRFEKPVVRCRTKDIYCEATTSTPWNGVGRFAPGFEGTRESTQYGLLTLLMPYFCRASEAFHVQ